MTIYFLQTQDVTNNKSDHFSADESTHIFANNINFSYLDNSYYLNKAF